MKVTLGDLRMIDCITRAGGNGRWWKEEWFLLKNKGNKKLILVKTGLAFSVLVKNDLVMSDSKVQIKYFGGNESREFFFSFDDALEAGNEFFKTFFKN